MTHPSFLKGNLAAPPSIHQTLQSIHCLLVLHRRVFILKTLGSPRTLFFKSQISLDWWGGETYSLDFYYQLINSCFNYQHLLGLSCWQQRIVMGQMTKTGWDRWQEAYQAAEGDAQREAMPSFSFPHLAQGRFCLGLGAGGRTGHCRVLKSDFANLTILPEANPTSDISSSFSLNFWFSVYHIGCLFRWMKDHSVIRFRIWFFSPSLSLTANASEGCS